MTEKDLQILYIYKNGEALGEQLRKRLMKEGRL